MTSTSDRPLDASPLRPVGSFATLAVLFLTLAVVQVAILLSAAVTFDLSSIRLTLLYVIGAPALLYGIVGAWDHRQLLDSGDPHPPKWVWALLLPPLYLALRALRAGVGRPARLGLTVGWIGAQVAISLAFTVIATAALIAVPTGAAQAVLGLSGAETARLLTAEGIEDAVEQDWADLGLVGEADCRDPLATIPGTQVSCQAVLEDENLSFTVLLTPRVAGERPWTIASWVEAPQG